MARVHNQTVRPFGISAVQANILALLFVEGPLTIGQVQTQLSLGSSTLTGAVDRMEKAGLVQRVAVADDRRSYKLQPASWPRGKTQDLLGTLASAEDACFAELTQTERRELSRLLTKAIASVEKVDDGSGQD